MAVTLYRQVDKGKTRRYQKVFLETRNFLPFWKPVAAP
jgi:hypothetical protein